MKWLSGNPEIRWFYVDEKTGEIKAEIELYYGIFKVYADSLEPCIGKRSTLGEAKEFVERLIK